MSVLHQNMCISKAAFSILRVLSEYKYKVPDELDSNQTVGTSCNSKLKLPIFKDLCTQSTEKLVKDECM